MGQQLPVSTARFVFLTLVQKQGKDFETTFRVGDIRGLLFVICDAHAV